MIVQPGSFRTEGILTYPYHENKRIPEYDAMRQMSLARAAALQGKQSGDPVQAAEFIVDLVRGEGKAKDRKFPRYLPLGDDAAQAIREKTGMMLDVLEEWKDDLNSLTYKQ